MSRSLGNTIADSLKLSIGYAQRLLPGVDASNYARFASPGGQTIESNHPAFILGHLALYTPRIATQLGRTELVVDLPAEFEGVFSKDAKCVDDPDGSIYPSLEAIQAVFTDGYDKVLTALQEADDQTLSQPNPTPGPMAERFPTLGSMHAFYVGGHMMMHLGQFSAWRRMSGLGAA